MHRVEHCLERTFCAPHRAEARPETIVRPAPTRLRERRALAIPCGLQAGSRRLPAPVGSGARASMRNTRAARGIAARCGIGSSHASSWLLRESHTRVASRALLRRRLDSRCVRPPAVLRKVAARRGEDPLGVPTYSTFRQQRRGYCSSASRSSFSARVHLHRTGLDRRPAGRRVIRLANESPITPGRWCSADREDAVERWNTNINPVRSSAPRDTCPYEPVVCRSSGPSPVLIRVRPRVGNRRCRVDRHRCRVDAILRALVDRDDEPRPSRMRP